MIRAKTRGNEELFSFRKDNGDRVVLTGRSVREEVKSTCALSSTSALIHSERAASRIWAL